MVFVAFSLATGGPSAIWFWALAAAGSFVLVGMTGYVARMFEGLFELIGEGLGSLTRLLLPPSFRWRERIATIIETGALMGPFYAAISGVFVYVAAGAVDAAPANLPVLSGWGIYVAFVIGSAAVVGSARVGLVVRDRLIPATVPDSPVARDVDRAGEYWTPVPIVGWRTWTWTGTELHGYFEAWATSEFAARCDTCSEIPGEDDTCGVYAVMRRDQVEAFAFAWDHRDVVVGRVELTGLVIEHERGYRAEHARIVELWASPKHITAISARYPDVIVRESQIQTST